LYIYIEYTTGCFKKIKEENKKKEKNRERESFMLYCTMRNCKIESDEN